MENNLALTATVSLVAVALVLGLIFQRFSGKGKSVSSKESIDLAKLRATSNGLLATEFGKHATLLQFSTEYCGICPGVKRQLAQIAYRQGGVSHIEVDITDRLDLAAHFSITQTPTVFVLDREGRIKFRVSGAPKPGVIQQEIERLKAID